MSIGKHGFIYASLVAGIIAWSQLQVCSQETPARADKSRVLGADAKADGVRELPLLQNDGFLLVAVEINGVSGFLAVDTGSMGTSMGMKSAELFKITLESSGKMEAGITGIIQNTKKGKLEGKVVGCSKEEFPLAGTFTFVPLPMEGSSQDGKLVLGVVGLDDLAKAGGVVDCGKNRLSLYPKGDYKGPSEWYHMAMSKFGTVNLFHWLAPVEINGRKCMMVVDTAAQGTVLTDDKFAKLAGVDLKDQANVMASGAGDGRQALKQGIISELKLGGKLSLGKIRVVGINMPTLGGNIKDADGEARPIVGILGMDHLVRTEAIIDCGQGILHVSSKEPQAVDTDTNYLDTNLVLKALQALAENGDKEDMDALDKAVVIDGHGQLSIAPDQAVKLVSRAREKGLIPKADEKSGDGK